ncbi:MAG: VanZ family protein [Planctomycetota bacterium]|jgi:VanZ family protein
MSGSDAVISRHGLINCLHAHMLEVLTAIYLLYILLGTLLPFDFSWSAAFGQGRTLLGLGSTPSGVPDLMSNIGLYVPLGVLLYCSLVRNVGAPRLSILAATLIAAAASLSVESVQLLSPTRISSVVDFSANLLGAAAGATVACLCRVPQRRLLASLASELGTDTSVTLVKVYAGLLVIGGLAPYTPTFDVTRLARSVQASTIAPFAQTRELAAQTRQAELDGRLGDAAGCRRDQMYLWARWFVEVVSFGLFAYLLHRLLRSNFGFQPGATLALVAYLTVLLALLISLLQVIVMSRGFHLTDMLMRAIGALCGMLMSGVVARRRHERRWTPDLAWSPLGKLALAAAVSLVVFTGLIPFSFTLDSQHVAAKVSSNHLLPFYAYHVGRFDLVCADFWGKSLRYGFLGIALWMCLKAGSARSLPRRALRITAVVVVVSVVVETCQFFLISRIPSLTDVIIAGLAAWAGTVCAQYAVDFYGRAVQEARPQTSARRALPGALSPTDALIASLIPDGVAEPVGTSLSEDQHKPG